MIIYQTIMCILILVVIPACMGLAVTADLKHRSFAVSLCFGYMVMMFAFELVTVPVLLLTEYGNFKYVLWIYTPVMLLIAAFGLFRAYRSGYLKDIADTAAGIRTFFAGKEQLIVWGAAFLILVTILILVSTRVIFDGDDAYYVTQSLIAQQKGTMYASNPYTGRAAPIDMRHALAVFTMWISYVGSVTHIHTTVLCHSVLPLVLIPLVLVIYGQTGAFLLGERRRELLGYFMIFAELFILFGRVSLYTPETFLLARTWQGKAISANILLPMVFMALWITADSLETSGEGGIKNRRAAWILLALLNASAGLFSSLAVVLVCVMIAAGGAVLAVIKKKPGIFAASCICCVPGVIYMLLYLYYTYLGWR